MCVYLYEGGGEGERWVGSEKKEVHVVGWCSV